jgi:hypothetical protein
MSVVCSIRQWLRRQQLRLLNFSAMPTDVSGVGGFCAPNTLYQPAAAPSPRATVELKLLFGYEQWGTQ